MLSYRGLSGYSWQGACYVHKDFSHQHIVCLHSDITSRHDTGQNRGHRGKLGLMWESCLKNHDLGSVEKIYQQNWPPHSVILHSSDLWVARLRGWLGFVTLASTSSQTLIHWFCCSMWRSELSRQHICEFVMIQEIIGAWHEKLEWIFSALELRGN